MAEGSSFRKSASMTNLSQFEQPLDSNADVAAGYASDDVVHVSARGRERKRGVPWTEEEHKLFLLGLQKVGKGDWRGISRNFVKTRTPTQVASHAQKYFLRKSNLNRRRRRSSLFDITADMYTGSAMEEDQARQEPIHLSCNIGGFPVPTFPMTLNPGVLPITRDIPLENLTLGRSDHQVTKTSISEPIRPLPTSPVPPALKMSNLNVNHTTTVESLPLSLKLSTPSTSDQQSAMVRHSSTFQTMSAGNFNNSGGDSIISVA